MDTPKLAELRQMLVERRAEIRGEVDRMASELRAIGIEQGIERGGVGNHMAEDGSNVMEAERLTTITDDIQAMLTQVESALERMDAGTYGTCQRCGQPINPERLAAFPYVAFCISCQSAIEPGPRPPLRSLTIVTVAGANGRPERASALVLTVAGLTTAADQASKLIITAGLGPTAPLSRLDLIGTWLALRYGENTGAAFGLLRQRTDALAVLSLLVLIGLIVVFRREVSRSPLLAVGVGLVAGGALGNLIDRARLGFVVDFIAVGWWPTFNLADSAITVGATLIVLRSIRSTRLPAPTRRDDPTTETADG